MNVSIVFEVRNAVEDPVVNSVWDKKEKAATMVMTLFNEGIPAYYKTYEVLDGEPRTSPHGFTE